MPDFPEERVTDAYFEPATPEEIAAMQQNNEPPQEPSEPQEPQQQEPPEEQQQEPEGGDNDGNDNNNEPPENQELQEPVQQQDLIQELHQITGQEFNSVQDVVNVIADYDKFKKDPYAYLGISAPIKAAIEAEKSGISPARFFSLASIDPDKMNKKELLRQQFMISNTEDAELDPEFMQVKFEQDFDAKYAILTDKRTRDDFDTEEEFLQFENRKKFAEKNLEFEAKKAGKVIGEWKTKSLTPEKQGPSEEEVARMQKAYELETSRVVGGLKHLTVNVSGKPVNVAIKPEEAKKVADALRDPLPFLKEIGFDTEAGKIDQAKFAELVSLYLLRDTMAERIAVSKTEMKNKTISQKLEHATTRQPVVHQNGQFVDDLAEAAALQKQKMGY